MAAITDTGKEKSKIHSVEINNKAVSYTVEDLQDPIGVCMLGDELMISDSHSIHSLDMETKELFHFCGKEGQNGFEDGPIQRSSLSSPVGFCSRCMIKIFRGGGGGEGVVDGEGVAVKDA